MLQHLADLFPKLENDISLRASLEKLPSLNANPDPSAVAQLYLEFEEILSRMTAGSMSDQEKFLMLVKKLHPKTFTELRSDRYYKHRTEDFGSLKEALLEKCKEDWLERHLFAQKKQVLQTLEAQPPKPMQIDSNENGQSQNGKGKGKGKGKGGGKGAGKGKGVTQNAKPYAKEQVIQDAYPKFSATIWCKWCHRRGHYEDTCWSKEKFEKKSW